MTGAQPYEHLAQVYDRWTADNDYAGWFGFIEQEWRGRPGQVRDVLEVCAGTGTVLEHFAARGYRVTGLDRSETMLDQARRKLGEDVELIRAELPELPAEGPFDAVLCLFDSLNYLGDDGSLRETLRAVARVLRPGGTFIFDVNSVRKLGDVFGLSHYGDDLGDFAYVWRNRFDPEVSCCDFLITLFVRSQDGTFERFEEQHTQYAYERHQMEKVARAAGFTGVEVYDNYRREPAGPRTLRETWVLTTPGEAPGPDEASGPGAV